MGYDILTIGAHPDDIEVAMGGTVAKLRKKGLSLLIVDLSDGEPARHGERGIRKEQAAEAAEILGVDRVTLDMQDRLITDTVENRLKVARLIGEHRPRWVFGTTGCGVHPDHVAVPSLVENAVFYARLPKWEEVPGGGVLIGADPWEIDRLFYYHWRMERSWKDFDFAVDVSEEYDLKLKAIRVYESVFSGEQKRLISRYEAEDQYIGSLFGVKYAEAFKSRAPLIVENPTVFGKVRYG